MMKQYLDLMEHVLNHGDLKEQRARLLSDGRTPKVKSVFGYQFRVDLQWGFPLLTTKKINFEHIKTELSWFLRGDTNVEYLISNGVKIWNEFANDDGDVGPVYGKQWRDWENPHGENVDQVAKLVQDIKKVRDDPKASEARRLIICSWNPVDVSEAKPPFCHSFAQWNVTEGRLSCHMYQRSADLFLGVPYNIASYSLFTHALAKVCGLDVGWFIHLFGDVHIYDNHFDQVTEQLSRKPLDPPELNIAGDFDSIDNFDSWNIELKGYNPHPAIRGAEVAV